MGYHKLFRKKCAVGLFLTFVVGALFSAAVTVYQLPDELTVQGGGNTRLSTLLPVSVDISDEGDRAKAKLFGVVGVKNVSLRREKPRKVLLAGTLFGLRMYCDGVMVVGLSDFKSHGERVNPAKKSGISRGDVIHSADGMAVSSNEEFAVIIENAQGEVEIGLTGSDGSRKSVRLTPEYSDADGCLKTGMWVRDSAAGIGTLTYIDPETGRFGGLGHGICDADTHGIIPIQDGEIYPACIMGVKRGVRGSAGEIRGYLCGEGIGVLRDNTGYGAFGLYTAEIPALKEYETAFKQDVMRGKAQILCTVTPDSEPKLYDAVIEKINYGGEAARNMIIRVTDEELLEETGGIVQGMSGSPVIQNGRFVGAVTHVFVNSPSRGYAIFAENMLAQTSRSK